MNTMKIIQPGLALSLALSLAAPVAHAARPGDQAPITGIHPSYSLENIRPAALNFSIGAMDFLSDGSLVVTSWKDPYGVFIIKNATGAKSGITVTEFASGLTETLGLKVVNDQIFVLQKDELTQLIDSDKDGKADEFKAIAYDWTKSTMEKEYAMGLIWDGTYFYGAFGDNTVNGGTAVNPVPAGRQNGVLRFSMDGTVEPFSGGLRVPGGLEYAFGEVWLTENQGGFRSMNPLYNIRYKRWYGRPVNPPSVYQPIPYRDLTDAETAPGSTTYSRAAVDMVFQQAGGRSPGNPMVVKSGLFKNQILVPDCDATYGGISRNFLEIVGGEFQGANFHFSRGFEGVGVYRIVTGPDGDIYAGANGSRSAGWQRAGHIGLDRLKLKAASDAFDMLAVRSKGNNSFEIEFTKPLNASLGNDVASHLECQKWFNRIKMEYGAGAKQGTATLTVSAAVVSADRKKVTATISGLSEGYVTWLHWKGDAIVSADNQKLWGTEAWYSLNKFGPGKDPEDNSVALQSALPAGSKPFRAGIQADRQLGVHVDLPAGSLFTVEVGDLAGRVHVRRSGAGRSDLVIPSDALPAGLHIVTLRSGNRTWSQLGHR